MSQRLRELRSAARMRLGGEVERVTVQVRGEQVIVSIREGALTALCTCGREECLHVPRALAWIAGEGAQDGEARVRSSLRPPAPERMLALPEACELADALEDVVLAVVRTGVGSGVGPSVRQTLSRVVERAPRPAPMGLTRWLGRLEVSLVQQELGTVARLLQGAARFAGELRLAELDAEQLARRGAWLGGAPVHGGEASARLTDRTLLEVGRERITGQSRRSLERRYLVDLQTGEVLIEERHADEPASLGPCPRALMVGLAEVEAGGVPRRVRLLQYEIAAEWSSEQWRALDGAVSQRVREITESYVESQRLLPGMAEPFVLFAPARAAAPPLDEPQDEEGRSLPVARAENAAYSALIRREASEREVLWIAGRVTDSGGTLLLRPVSLAVRDAPGKRPRLLRVA